LIASAARPRRKEIVEVEATGDEEIVDGLPTCTSKVAYTKEESKDPDAAWVKKGKKCVYGYNTMITTNLNGFISGVITTPANVNDCKIALQSIAKANLKPYYPLLGDKAFDVQYIRDYLSESKLHDFIMRMKKRGEIDSEARASRNKLISKVRYVIERTFGYLKLKLGGARSRYIGLKKTHNWNLMNAMLYNLIRFATPLQVRCARLP